MMFRLQVFSWKSYPHAWVCNHQGFVIGWMPIHSCNCVHRTQQNWIHPVEMHLGLPRTIHESLPLELVQHVWFPPDFEHGVTAQNKINKQTLYVTTNDLRILYASIKNPLLEVNPKSMSTKWIQKIRWFMEECFQF